MQFNLLYQHCTQTVDIIKKNVNELIEIPEYI